MGSRQAFAAIDLGASSGRVILGWFEDDRISSRELHRFPNIPRHDQGALVWDLDELFAQMLEGLSGAVRFCTHNGFTLAGIGVDTWGVDYALLSPAGEIGRARHYRDSSPVTMRDALRSVSASRLYAINGVIEHHINTAFQLRDDLDGGLLDGAVVLLMPDLMTYLLSGAIGAELTIASTTGLLDRRTDTWSADVLAMLDLPRSALPALHAPGSLAGSTTRTITGAIGAGAPVPVYRVAGHDTASAMAVLSSSNADAGRVGVISCGSWSLAGVVTAEPVMTPVARRRQFTNELGAEGANLLLRNLNGMWLLQECLRCWSAKDARPVALGSLLEQAATVDVHGARFDVDDASLFAPDSMPDRIAELCAAGGHPKPQGRPAMVRVILESLAQAFAATLRDAAELAGTSLETVRIGGGGANNALLCQLTADATGLPVLGGPSEASSVGNLAIQLVAAGVCSSVAQAVGAAEILDRYLPGAAHSDLAG